MRGKTIMTFIAYEALRQLADLADGESLDLLTDAREEIDNDIRAWCHAGDRSWRRPGAAGADINVFIQ